MTNSKIPAAPRLAACPGIDSYLVYSPAAITFVCANASKKARFLREMIQVLLFVLYLAVAVGIVYLIGAAIKSIFNGR